MITNKEHKTSNIAFIGRYSHCRMMQQICFSPKEPQIFLDPQEDFWIFKENHGGHEILIIRSNSRGFRFVQALCMVVECKAFNNNNNIFIIPLWCSCKGHRHNSFPFLHCIRMWILYVPTALSNFHNTLTTWKARTFRAYGMYCMHAIDVK